MATRKPAAAPPAPAQKPQTQRPTDTPMPRGADPAGQATSSSVDHEQIARRAYERYLERNGEHGRDQEDWLEAERELRNSRR